MEGELLVREGRVVRVGVREATSGNLAECSLVTCAKPGQCFTVITLANGFRRRVENVCQEIGVDLGAYVVSSQMSILCER